MANITQVQHQKATSSHGNATSKRCNGTMVPDALLDAQHLLEPTRLQGMVFKSFLQFNQSEQELELEGCAEAAINSEAISASEDEERCREVAAREDRAYCLVQSVQEAAVAIR